MTASESHAPRLRLRALFAVLLLLVLPRLLSASARAQEPPAAVDPPFPPELVRWRPIPGDPVLFAGAGPEAWDRRIRERGYILAGDGEFRMWYTGYNDDLSPLRRLGLATSPDGLTWTRHPDNPLVPDAWIEDVHVVPHEGGYLMVAEGEHDLARQWSSPDGIRWTDEGRLDVRLADGRPIPPGPYGTPTLVRWNDRWRLLYERGDRGVWLAESTDRKVWTNLSDEPVLRLGPDPYDREAVALNQVLLRDGFFYAVYHANAHRPWRDWTTCVARSRDLLHWEKHPANPVIGDNRSSGILVQTDRGLRLYTMHAEVRAHEPDPDARPK